MDGSDGETVALHLQTSWDRVVPQTMPLLIFVAVSGLAARIRDSDAPTGPGVTPEC